MDSMIKVKFDGKEIFPLIRELLSSGNAVRFTVTGRSMMPWIADGRDEVLLSSPAKRRLCKGDIILFQTEQGKYILHRIHEVGVNGLRTTGDGSLFDDGLVKPEQVIGVVEKIYRKGREITCDTFTWRFIFMVWRKLLPIRGSLLGGYTTLSRLKGRIRFLLAGK